MPKRRQPTADSSKIVYMDEAQWRAEKKNVIDFEMNCPFNLLQSVAL